MKLLLRSAYQESVPGSPSRIRFIRNSANKSRKHFLANSDLDADAVLFTEAWRHHDKPFFRLLGRKIDEQKRTKPTFIYCDSDHPPYLGAGFYPSLEHGYSFANQLASHYVTPLNRDFENLPEVLRRSYTMSFTGSFLSHPIRKKLTSLHDVENPVVDTSSLWIDTTKSVNLRETYIQTLRQSRFALCPRGKGVSSYRIFEALAVGTVPIIISDRWCRPVGPDWDKIAIFVRECDVGTIRDIISERQKDWAEMSEAAKAAYSRYFSTEVLFDYLCDNIEAVLNRGVYHLPPGLQFVANSMSNCRMLIAECKIIAKGFLKRNR